mmetsp:Transcript_40120/g.65227  ORF Transcript_40120/g.65227 Transcript_40120/m.65227 type:complete len:176 (-) Transcript_40120:21-548(-)
MSPTSGEEVVAMAASTGQDGQNRGRELEAKDSKGSGSKAAISLKTLEKMVDAAMAKDPEFEETKKLKAAVYFELESYHMRYVSQPDVAEYCTKRRRLLRDAKKDKSKKAAVDILDRSNASLHASIEKVNHLRQRLALRPPEHTFLDVLVAILRNIAMFTWITCAVPLCFAVALLR